MKVTDQTRAIIQQGLMQLNKDRERHLVGLARERKLNETGVAFQIVPALNAVGRLSNLANVNNVVRYFLSNQTSVIASMQNQILQLNTQRKKLSEQMVKIAKEKCKKIFCWYVMQAFMKGLLGWLQAIFVVNTINHVLF